MVQIEKILLLSGYLSILLLHVLLFVSNVPLKNEIIEMVAYPSFGKFKILGTFQFDY